MGTKGTDLSIDAENEIDRKRSDYSSERQRVRKCGSVSAVSGEERT